MKLKFKFEVIFCEKSINQLMGALCSPSSSHEMLALDTFCVLSFLPSTAQEGESTWCPHSVVSGKLAQAPDLARLESLPSYFCGFQKINNFSKEKTYF